MRAGQRCKVTFFSPLILIRDSCKTISVIGYSEYALRTGFPDPYQSIHEDKEQDYSLENQSHSGRSFAALIEVKSHMRPPPLPFNKPLLYLRVKGIHAQHREIY